MMPKTAMEYLMYCWHRDAISQLRPFSAPSGGKVDSRPVAPVAKPAEAPVFESETLSFAELHRIETEAQIARGEVMATLLRAAGAGIAKAYAAFSSWFDEAREMQRFSVEGPMDGLMHADIGVQPGDTARNVLRKVREAAAEAHRRPKSTTTEPGIHAAA